MKVFTEKEIKALVTALRTFIRDMSGKRMEEKRATEALRSALDGGILLDVLFNPQNFLRVKSQINDPTVEDYIKSILEYEIDAHSIREETDWKTNGLETVAHVYHDWYCVFEPKGGVCNTPTALSNLASLIEKIPLESVLCEELINAVAEEGKMTAYTYITSLLSGKFDLLLRKELTQEEYDRAMARYLETGSAPGVIVEDESEDDEEAPEAFADEPDETEDSPVDRYLKMVQSEEEQEEPDEEEASEKKKEEEWPDPADSVEFSETEDFEQELYDPYANYSVKPSPYSIKFSAVESAMKELTLQEISGLAETMDDGQFLKLNELVDRLTTGNFDTSLEGVEVKQTHMLLSSMLMPQFINCCRMNGVDMDEEKASAYDILKADWDLRNPRTRTFNKLRELILHNAGSDPDLMKAIPELERYYEP